MKCPHCGKKISKSDIAREIGRHTSEKKAKASAENGKKGGRPRKEDRRDDNGNA